jgi:rod shape determining protein RodA
MVKIQKNNKNNINKISRLLLLLSIIALPLVLIIMQPDYGTAMAFIVAICLMLFAAGIDKKYIIVAFLLVIIGIPLAYNFLLPEHAKTRIEVFLNPDIDPRGAGYNIIQSKLAIGAGRLWGMGILKGNQTQLGYLYPKTTDFIFSVIGEELGFVFSVTVIVLYVVMITKSIYVAKTAKNDLGSYIAIGIAGIFLFHMVENIGMTMGLLPITGVPLPFVSYGGTSMITNFMCIAMLLNISGRRQKTIFMN